MEMRRSFVAVFIFLSMLQCVVATETESGVSEMFNALLERIESLEARDEEKNAKIAEMESEISGLKLQMGEMELKFKQKESKMVDEINGLKKTLEQSHSDTEEHQEDNRDDIERPISIPSKIKLQRSSFRKNRESPENEVAFYATHTYHVVHHLADNQILRFQQPITNIGNAYNTSTGIFVAPVDGTYVFHATVMGDIDLNTLIHPDRHNETRMFAYFDVNGMKYSKFYVTDRDQASQMLVIELTAGHTVTMRNAWSGDGFLGEHFSTFSGFLLYQHNPSGAIIG